MEPVGLVFQVAGINHSYQATDESDIESMNLNCILLYNTVPDGIPGHTRLQRDSLRPPILRAGNKIEVHGLSPHSLRRTAATLMDQAGIGAKTIQRQMRHKDFATTAGYIQSGLKDLEEAQEKVWGAS